MSAEHPPQPTQAYRSSVSAVVSRRSFLTAAVATGASVAGWSRWRSGARAQDRESAAAVNVLATAEGLLVTFLGVARTRATDLVLDENTVRLLRSAQCQQDAHYNNLVAEGGSPAVGSYTIADS